MILKKDEKSLKVQTKGEGKAVEKKVDPTDPNQPSPKPTGASPGQPTGGSPGQRPPGASTAG
jgi:hypothetical protein